MPIYKVDQLDRIDKQILSLLQKDAAVSLQQISEQLNLTSTPCWNRIKRLEKSGVIKQRVKIYAFGVENNVCGQTR